MPLEGQQIGRYRLIRLLGSGGMGDVYLAEDARIEQQIAIKVMRAEVSPYPTETEKVSEGSARLFQREARAIAKLDHPNILPLFDFGEERIGDTTIMFLVMPYREQGSLASWLRKQTNGTLLTPSEVAHIVQQAALALQHAHNRQVIHQDVKPSNFLLRFREDAPDFPDLLLADFGIARFMTATSSASQSIRGTPSYMAPEQWEGEPTPATDQYALGVMAYELLTGKLPFQGGPGKMMYQHIHVQPQPPSTVNPRISSDVDTVLLHALAKEPAQRFASITAFANAFRLAVEGKQSVREGLPISNPKNVGKALLPVPPLGLDTAAPTIPHSSVHSPGSDSETYLKPINTPIPLSTVFSSSQAGKPNLQDREEGTEIASTGNTKVPLFIENNPITSAPVTMPKNAFRTTKRRPMLLIVLIVLVLALTAAGIRYAIPSFFGTRISGTSPISKISRISTPSHGPGVSNSAAVTIIPVSNDLKSLYTISAIIGATGYSDHQVGAGVISATTSSNAQTVNATGVGSIPGTHASGTVLIDNFDTSSSLTLNAGSVYVNNYSSIHIHMVLDATVTVPPAPSSTTWSQGAVPGHILEVGTIGNNEFNNNEYGTLSWSVFNNPFFSNGKDSQNYTDLQQSDINNAANALIGANTPDPQQVLQPQIQTNQRLIATPQCVPHVSSNHQAGDRVTNVTVTVNFTCTGEVYDYDGALSLAATLLKTQARTDPGSSYVLVGTTTATMIKATLTDPSNGTITLLVNAEGIWVYQFSSVQQQQLTHLISGKSKQEAIKLLAQEPGVSKVNIQISGGDNLLLPTDPGRISIIVQRVPGS